MPKITVSQGDSIPSIAKDNGFFPDTIWNHPENAELRSKRQSMNQLFPGDEVFVPELQKRVETKGTDAVHKFKRKGVPAKIKVQLKRLGKPRKNEKYILNIDGIISEGTLDGDGTLEHFIPPNAKSGQLLLHGGDEIIPLQIGYLNPPDTVSGAQQRLNNIGFLCGNEDGDLDDQTQAAIRKFQQTHKLPETGEVDGATISKLRELHP